MLEDQPKRGNITKVDTKVEKSRLVLKISRRAVKICFLPILVISSTYDWLQKLRKFNGENLNKRMCLIGDSFDNPGVSTVWRIFKHCHIQVTDICINEYGDFDEIPVCLLERLIYSLHRITKVVVVFKQNQDHEQLRKVIDVIMKNRRLMPDRVCFALSDGTDQNNQILWDRHSCLEYF